MWVFEDADDLAKRAAQNDVEEIPFHQERPINIKIKKTKGITLK